MCEPKVVVVAVDSIDINSVVVGSVIVAVCVVDSVVVISFVTVVVGCPVSFSVDVGNSVVVLEVMVVDN